jgi:ribosomal protein S20
MAVTKSAQKALRQQEKRNKLNNMYRKKIKDLVKKARALIAEKKTE